MPPRGSKKLPCPLGDGMSFWGQHYLDAHLRKTHHQCPWCDRSYIRLDMHARAAHPMEYNDWANES